MVCVNLADRFIEAFKAWTIVDVKWRDIVLLKDVGKISVATLTSASGAAVIRMLMFGQRPLAVLVICSIAFGCIYAGLFWLLGVPTTEERDIVRRRMSRAQRFLGSGRIIEPAGISTICGQPEPKAELK
jgi:hypothetical protein